MCHLLIHLRVIILLRLMGSKHRELQVKRLCLVQWLINFLNHSFKIAL